MVKTLKIEGMSCSHCSKAVETALKAVNGVSGATVDLEKNSATVEFSASVENDILTAAIEDAGYEVIGIS